MILAGVFGLLEQGTVQDTCMQFMPEKGLATVVIMSILPGENFNGKN